MTISVSALGDIAAFEKLLPQLSIGSANRQVGTPPLPTEEKLQQEVLRLRSDGYYVFERLFCPDAAQELALAVRALGAADIPPIFLIVYDAFWRLLESAYPTISRLLDDDFALLPEVWVWHLDPAKSQAGWRPHRDAVVHEDRGVRSITMWFSLTDATCDNGCIHLLPKSCDRGYPSTLDFDQDTLQQIRAVPVPAGSLIGWDQSVFHWGGRADPRASVSRISFACEARPRRLGLPPHEIAPKGRPLDGDARLNLIARQLKQYQHIHHLPQIYAEFASSRGE